MADGSAIADRVCEFRLTIAGLTLAMIADADMPLRVDGAMAAFLADEAVPDLVVRARWGDLTSLAPVERVFDAGPLWQLSRDAHGRLHFRFSSPALGPVPYKTASIDADLTTGEVHLHRPYFANRGPVYPLEYPLDELLLIQLLAAGRGAEVHACGVVHPSGRGLVFAGQSGAGKTTMGRLWVGGGRQRDQRRSGRPQARGCDNGRDHARHAVARRRAARGPGERAAHSDLLPPAGQRERRTAHGRGRRRRAGCW